MVYPLVQLGGLEALLIWLEVSKECLAQSEEQGGLLRSAARAQGDEVVLEMEAER